MNNLLIIRFSAMGDVAMTVPVIHALATQYPNLSITMLTRKRFVPLFATLPKNVRVKGIHLGQFKGIRGLGRLYQNLKCDGYDAVADFHDVLRTKYLRMRFRLAHKQVAVIDKGRAEKKALIGHGMDAAPLRPMVERYADVLHELGLNVVLKPYEPPHPTEDDWKDILYPLGNPATDKPWVGIAPFAAHADKIYPAKQMRQVAEMLADAGVQVFLFGAGQNESDMLKGWERDGIISVCGKLISLLYEMYLMTKLKAMVAMDSANMHIAAMMGTPVISIWGATHPKAGFTPWQQPADRILQANDLACRPCSIYGKKPCQFGDLRCMNSITPQQIFDRVMKEISQ